MTTVFHVQFPRLGLNLTIDRVAFRIGSMNIYWYGICIALGMLLGLMYVFRKCRDAGINEDRLTDVILLSTVCGIIGARAYYVIFAPFRYNSFWEVIDIRNGGVAIYGAVIVGFLAALLFCKWRRVPVLPAFDLVSVGFLIGQGLGRWGNFFNQEAFGTNTSGLLGMYSEGTQNYLASVQSTLAAAGVTVDPTAPVHPTFLYESVWCLLGALLLALYFKHRRFHGEMFLMYIMWYGFERMFVEGLRTDSLETFLGLRVSQLLAAVSLAAAFIVWLGLRQKYSGKPLVIHYSFPVKAQDGPGCVEMSWPASGHAPTKDEVEAAYRAAQEKAAAEEKTAADKADADKTETEKAAEAADKAAAPEAKKAETDKTEEAADKAAADTEADKADADGKPADAAADVTDDKTDAADEKSDAGDEKSDAADEKSDTAAADDADADKTAAADDADAGKAADADGADADKTADSAGIDADKTSDAAAEPAAEKSAADKT